MRNISDEINSFGEYYIFDCCVNTDTSACNNCRCFSICGDIRHYISDEVSTVLYEEIELLYNRI